MFSASKRGSVAPEIVLAELIGRLDGAGEEAAAERAERHEADAELAADIEHAVFRVARPQRIFALHGGDRMHGMRPADGGDACLRQAERAHLALAHQLGHGADRVLDRHVGIDAVLVVEIDDVEARALQRGHRHGADMLRACC